MNRRDLMAPAAGLALLGAAATPVQAQAPAAGIGTLDRIIRERRLRVTAEVTSPPFGILGRDGQPDGSEIQTGRQLARDLGVEIEFVQVTGPQRIPALLAGRADVAISSLSITHERARTVMFASPHGALSIVIAGPQRVQIRNAADLAGKRIGLTRATLEEATVPRIAPQGTNIVFFDDAAATFQALVSGQVDAAGMSAFASKSLADRNPRLALEDKFTVTTAFYGAAVRPGDFDLLQFINTWVFLNKQNGVLAGIFQDKTGVPLPPLPTI